VEKLDPIGTAAPGRPSQARLGSVSPSEVPVLFDTRKHPTRIYARAALRPGKQYTGPAIITEYSATTVIPPSTKFHLDRAANLVIILRR